MLNGEAINTNFIVFGLTRSGLEPTIYHTQGEHAYHYTTNAVHHHIKDDLYQVCYQEIQIRRKNRHGEMAKSLTMRIHSTKIKI